MRLRHDSGRTTEIDTVDEARELLLAWSGSSD
jgi:hypothetical protein